MRDLFVKKIVLATASVLTIIGAVSIFLLLKGPSEYNVEFIVAPKEAEILLDGQSMSRGKHLIEHGTYEVIISRTGFATYQDEVVIEDGSVAIVAIPLTPESEGAIEIYNNQIDQYTLVEEIAGAEAQRQGQEFLDKNPLATKLPFSNDVLNLNYRVDDQRIVIESEVAGNSSSKSIDERKLTFAAIESLGFNPNDYTISYSPSFKRDLDHTDEDFTINVVNDGGANKIKNLKYGEEDIYLDIDLHPTPDNLFVFEIEYTKADLVNARSQAFSYIRKQGYSPNGFRITYRPVSMDREFGNNSNSNIVESE